MARWKIILTPPVDAVKKNGNPAGRVAVHLPTEKFTLEQAQAHAEKLRAQYAVNTGVEEYTASVEEVD